MNLVFIGTGPAGRIPREGANTPASKSAERAYSRDKRLQSSLFISDECLLIDVTRDVEKQIAVHNIDNINNILITHASDETVGGLARLNQLAEDDAKTNVYLEKETYNRISEMFDKDALNSFDFKFIEPYKEYEIGNLKVIPVTMPYSDTPDKIPNVGFILKNDVGSVFYCPFTSAPSSSTMSQKSRELIEKADVIIWDGSLWDGKSKTHNSILKSKKKLLKLNNKLIFFTNIGINVPRWKDAVRELKSIDSKFNIAFDGLSVSINELLDTPKKLSYGLYNADANKIYSGEQKELILPSTLDDFVGKEMYLFDDEYAYGTIFLYEPETIGESYMFDFDFVPYDEPKQAILPEEKFIILNEFRFIEELLNKPYKDYIKSIPDLPDKVLIDDHRILHAWYSTLKKKKDYSLKNGWNAEDIWNAHKFVVAEMKKRGFQHNTPLTPNPPHLQSEEMSQDISFIDSFTDIVINDSFVSLVGSTIENNRLGNDIDVLIRMAEPTSFIRRAVETRMIKMLNEEYPELAGKLHFIWGDEPGPHDTFVPLYDLVLKKREPRVVQMSAMRPQKPNPNAYYDMKDLVDAMFKKAKSWYVERKWDGFHISVDKANGDVQVITEDGSNISKSLNHFKSALSKLGTDFRIDGEMLWYDNGKWGSRINLLPFVQKGGETPDDSNIRLVVWDIIRYNGKNLKDLPLEERKKYLDKLHFNDTVMKIKSYKADNPKDALKYIKQVSKIKESEGAVVKETDAKYVSGDSTTWLKYRKLTTLHVRVLEKHKAGSANNYTVGIDVKNPDIYLQKYIVHLNGKTILKLGKTFNTKLNASPGDIIDISVQEVWRHEYKNGIRYSIHKPRVDTKRPDLHSTSNRRELERAVDALGVAIVEYGDTLEQDIKDAKHMGMIDQVLEAFVSAPFWDKRPEFLLDQTPAVFPKQKQDDFKRVMERGVPRKFVMQWHERGATNHTDLRMDVGDHLQGFTITEPANITQPNPFTKKKLAYKKYNTVDKLIQPKAWLKVQGVAPIGAPGSTKHFPGIFTIVDNGIYLPEVIEDHRMIFLMHSNDFKINPPKEARRPRESPDFPKRSLPIEGRFEVSIAHIGDRHVWLFYKLKDQSNLPYWIDKKKV